MFVDRSWDADCRCNAGLSRGAKNSLEKDVASQSGRVDDVHYRKRCDMVCKTVHEES